MESYIFYDYDNALYVGCTLHRCHIIKTAGFMTKKEAETAVKRLYLSRLRNAT